jgi:ketosteroid isomerase-like protein
MRAARLPILVVRHLWAAAQGAEMPTRERVQAFVAIVEANDFVEAIRQFYTEDATMQENLGAIRARRDALIAGEEAVLRGVKAITTRPGSTYAIDGDRVIVRWMFDIELPDGRKYTLDELAHQTWRGDRIAQERFYYDPAQRKPE